MTTEQKSAADARSRWFITEGGEIAQVCGDYRDLPDTRQVNHSFDYPRYGFLRGKPMCWTFDGVADQNCEGAKPEDNLKSEVPATSRYRIERIRDTVLRLIDVAGVEGLLALQLVITRLERNAE